MILAWCHILHSIWSNNRFTEWWITMQCSWKSLNNTDNFLQKSMCYADNTPYAQNVTLWSKVDGNQASIYNCHGELCKFLCMCKLLCKSLCNLQVIGGAKKRTAWPQPFTRENCSTQLVACTFVLQGLWKVLVLAFNRAGCIVIV